MNDAMIDRYCRFFEQLSPTDLAQIDELFSEAARFRDPFNHVRGRAAIRRIFEHLLEQHPRTRFKVIERCRNGLSVYLRWTFEPDRDRDLCIEGVSHVRFDQLGRVVEHRDYWDSAGELFARLPLTGAPTRWLLRRAQANPGDQLT